MVDTLSGGEAAVPVIIPAFKAEAQLAKCLDHLNRQTVRTNPYIRDNSVNNIYFTAAINEGLRHFLKSDPAYIILLNQDMYLFQNAVENLVAFMDRRPACGIAQPLQVHQKDTQLVICGGGLQAFPFGKHEYGHISQFQDAEIPWANGACMILRTEMVREIGLLDENMSFIGSDSDYCFTARARGWEVWRCASASGVHEAGGSANITNPMLEKIKLENMLYFSQKWLSGGIYRQLSIEGPMMTTGSVSAIEEKLAATAKALGK